jgi:predicted DCC family thiol-disulfide oxidoreductase YuxK
VIAAAIFAFVPIQLAEGRPLAEQLGINPDRPDSFAFVATGQAYVKSEAALRIARELPRWQWTWVFHFIPRVIRAESNSAPPRHSQIRFHGLTLSLAATRRR